MKIIVTLVALLAFTIEGPAQIRETFSRPDRILKTHLRDQSFRKIPGCSALGTKSGTSAKQKLDSVLSESRDPVSNQWWLSNKEEYSYDGRGNVTTSSYYDRYPSGKEWVGSDRQETAFDSEGNLILMISYLWDSLGKKWMEDYKNEYVFENGNKKYDRDFTWDKGTNQWVNDGVMTYEYSDGSLVSSELSGKDVNEDGIRNYLDRSRTEYTYDPEKMLIREISYANDGTNWIKDSKIEYTYTANRKMGSLASYYWAGQQTGWVKFTMVEYTYDLAGDLSSEIYSISFMPGIWTMLVKQDYHFDGSLSWLVLSQWDDAAGAWAESNKAEYTYNKDYSIGEIILPYFYPLDYFKHMVTGYTNYEKTGSTWTATDRGTVYYSTHTASGIIDAIIPKITVYPNPANGFVTFDGYDPDQVSTVEFYDISGKPVSSTTIRGNGKVSVGHLPGGLYFYRLQTGDSVKRGKLVIQ
jgi:hypothetical protein